MPKFQYDCIPIATEQGSLKSHGFGSWWQLELWSNVKEWRRYSRRWSIIWKVERVIWLSNEELSLGIFVVAESQRFKSRWHLELWPDVKEWRSYSRRWFCFWKLERVIWLSNGELSLGISGVLMRMPIDCSQGFNSFLDAQKYAIWQDSQEIDSWWNLEHCSNLKEWQIYSERRDVIKKLERVEWLSDGEFYHWIFGCSKMCHLTRQSRVLVPITSETLT